MASKVFENTARRIVIYSDDGSCKLIATRRANKTERYGHTAFRGSYWILNTLKRTVGGYEPIVFSGLNYRYDFKKDIIDALQSSTRFTEAYKELSA
ncbi:MAG: hypothetical protein IKP36_05310 [Bacteroidaceae bacterium]|nr:hypothetical protein [Bacteroidaceae bacterium]